MSKKNRTAPSQQGKVSQPVAARFAVPAGVLTIEAVNLDAAIFDTQDISTIRGAGLALLAATDKIWEALWQSVSAAGNRRPPISLLTRGASKLELLVDGAGEDADLLLDRLLAVAQEAAKQVTDFDGGSVSLSGFTIVCEAASRAEVNTALVASRAEAVSLLLERARSKLRLAQMRQLGFGLPPGADTPAWNEVEGLCALGSGFPATARSAQQRVSSWVRERREFGRHARQAFLPDQLREADRGDLADALADRGIEFVRSLADMEPTAAEASRLHLRAAALGKVALIHIDGNRFGAVRASLGGDHARLAKFTKYVRDEQGKLLSRIIEFALERDDMVRPAAESETGAPQLRLETLLWGGDELVFVVPAWRCLELMELIQKQLLTWRVPYDVKLPAGMPSQLTHAMAGLIASTKTPIRQLRKAVDDLVSSVKEVENGRTGFASVVLALEGASLPDGDLGATIRRQFHLPPEMASAPVAAIAFPAAKGPQSGAPVAPFSSSLALLVQLASTTTGSLSRSQANTLKALAVDGNLGWPGSKDVGAMLIDELERTQDDAGHRALVMAALRNPKLGTAALAPLVHLISLYDYLPMQNTPGAA